MLSADLDTVEDVAEDTRTQLHGQGLQGTTRGGSQASSFNQNTQNTVTSSQLWHAAMILWDAFSPILLSSLALSLHGHVAAQGSKADVGFGAHLVGP